MIPGIYRVQIGVRFPEFNQDFATEGSVIVTEDGGDTYQDIVDGLVAACSASAQKQSAENGSGIIIPESAVTSIIFLQIELIQVS